MFPPQMPPASAPPVPPQGQIPPPTQAPPVPLPAVPQVKPIDDTPIPMTADELAAWWSRVDLAIQARKDRETRWDALLKAYLPTSDPEALNSNTHFRNTEQKKATIFGKAPEFILTPLMPLQAQMQGPDGQVHSAEDVVFIKQAVLAALLGRDGVDLKRLADEVLFELLQVSGLGPTVISYECDKVPVKQMDPLTGLETTIDVPIFEEWTWKKFSSKKLLKPADWKSTRFDESPWLGYQGVKPLAVAKKEGLVPEDFAPNATKDEHVFEVGSQSTRDAGGAELLEYVMIWYRPALIDGSVPHRQMQRRLVLVKGMDQPAKHTKSPYQTLGEDGRLTADSMVGYPIHVFTLRDLTDSSDVPSDAAMTDPLVRQENIWASQDIKMRDANIPRGIYDNRLKEALDKLANGDEGDWAGVDQAVLAGGIDRVIAQLPRLEKAMADVQGRAQIKQLINETLAIGPNQSGATNDRVLSATEINNAQGSSNVVMGSQQDRFMSQMLVGVRKYDSLVQRFATDTDYVSWVGQDGSRRLAAWNMTLIAGRYGYDIKPDSQTKGNEAQQRQQDIQFTNLMANAPEANRAELLRELARDFGKDPAKLIQPPPPKQPELPKVNLSIASPELNPMLPEYANVYQVLTQLGFKGLTAPNPMAILNQPPPPTEDQHGGALDGSGNFEPVSKHASAITGQPAGRGPM